MTEENSKLVVGILGLGELGEGTLSALATLSAVNNSSINIFAYSYHRKGDYSGIKENYENNPNINFSKNIDDFLSAKLDVLLLTKGRGKPGRPNKFRNSRYSLWHPSMKDLEPTFRDLIGFSGLTVIAPNPVGSIGQIYLRQNILDQTRTMGISAHSKRARIVLSQEVFDVAKLPIDPSQFFVPVLGEHGDAFIDYSKALVDGKLVTDYCPHLKTIQAQRLISDTINGSAEAAYRTNGKHHQSTIEAIADIIQRIVTNKNKVTSRIVLRDSIYSPFTEEELLEIAPESIRESVSKDSKFGAFLMTRAGLELSTDGLRVVKETDSAVKDAPEELRIKFVNQAGMQNDLVSQYLLKHGTHGS
jgi:malate/lactate dehydrogenase